MSKLGRVRPAELVASSSKADIDSRSTAKKSVKSSLAWSASKLSSQKSFLPSSKLPQVQTIGKNVPISAQKIAQTTKNTNAKKTNVKNRILDAIYFICPDCSCVQCSAIISGLLVVVILILVFLYVGGYWDSKKEQQLPNKA